MFTFGCENVITDPNSFVKSPQIFQWRFNSFNSIPVFCVPPCLMYCMPCLWIFFVLVMFSLWIFPQDGGLSAPQRSRVGSLRHISTHTVAHGMIWNLVLLKPERVSDCKLSWLSYTYPNTASHILLNSHTQIPPMFSVLRLWSVTKWSKHTYFQAHAYAWHQAGLNTSLCMPAIISRV